MKYVSPKYERAELEISDILMSSEKYSISEGTDEKGNPVFNVIMGAHDLFN